MSNYLQGNISYHLTDWLVAGGSIGLLSAQGAKRNLSHSDLYYDVGMTAAWRRFGLDLRYVATDLGPVACQFYQSVRNACVPAKLASVTYSFPF